MVNMLTIITDMMKISNFLRAIRSNSHRRTGFWGDKVEITTVIRKNASCLSGIVTTGENHAGGGGGQSVSL